MPKDPATPEAAAYINAASKGLIPPFNITPTQMQLRTEVAQAQATLALAIAQVEANRIAETANLIGYLGVATQHRLAYQPGENVLKAVQANVETRLGLA